jgi:NADPH:quinone reductase-like Zn-dependent oxidoreductase
MLKCTVRGRRGILVRWEERASPHHRMGMVRGMAAAGEVPWAGSADRGAHDAARVRAQRVAAMDSHRDGCFRQRIYQIHCREVVF